MLDHIEAENRSYEIARTVNPGDTVVALQDLREGIVAGENVTVRSTTNAGFRGIEFSGVTDNGAPVHGLSLGYFTPDWMF